MSDGKVERSAKMFQQVRHIVDHHDSPGVCDGTATGVMMAYADIERVGWEPGDLVYPSKDIRVEAGGQYGSIRVLCNGSCDQEREAEVEVEVPVKVDSEKRHRRVEIEAHN